MTETIRFVPDQQENSLSDIVEENFSQDMSDNMDYQKHMDMLRESEPVADYKQEDKDNLVEKALEMALLYSGVGPYRGGMMHNGMGSYSRYGDDWGRRIIDTPYRHPSQDLTPSNLPSMDYINKIQEDERKHREALYNNWATDTRKHDDGFIGGIGLPGTRTQEHFHGPDPNRITKSHIHVNPFTGNQNYDDDRGTDHPWFDNGYNASMRDYQAQINNQMNRFLNKINGMSDDYDD